jgi:MoxR-like ATPase
MDEQTAVRGEIASLMQRILYEVKRVVVGQDHFLERVLVAMLAQGHLLVEGVPGLAKTLTVKTLARTVRGQFKRSVHPDLFRPISWAPACTSAPVNSAPCSDRYSPICSSPTRSTRPRQGAERAARGDAGTPGDDCRGDPRVPAPFLVMATQNPIGEGTYPLPEAQSTAS